MPDMDMVSKAEVLDIYAELYDEFDDAPGIIRVLHQVYDKLNRLQPQEPVVSPTAVGWISVKDDMPKEHPSIFAPYYGTEKWNRAMWRNESDRVLVAIRFPDGTCTVDKGRLQDGVWKTGVSPVLPQEVTHWAMWPEPPKEVNNA